MCGGGHPALRQAAERQGAAAAGPVHQAAPAVAKLLMTGVLGPFPGRRTLAVSPPDWYPEGAGEL